MSVQGGSYGGIRGWLHGLWHKQPILLGFSEVVCANFSHTMAADGNYFFESIEVPEGEIWVINNCGMRDADNIVTQLEIRLKRPGYNRILIEDYAPAAGRSLIYNGEVVLEEGDTLYYFFSNAKDTDDIYAHYWGRKIDVDQ